MSEELVRQSVELPDGSLDVWQPEESAELPDSGPVEWAPIAPYWSVLWRSGVALAREVAGRADELRGRRTVEIGCGLALPSLAAARAGADALATDADAEAVELVRRNARENGTAVEAAAVDWTRPDALLGRAPFDLALAADVLYRPGSTESFLSLLPRLAPEAWIADPDRPGADPFFELARERWDVETVRRGVVAVHRIRLR